MRAAQRGVAVLAIVGMLLLIGAYFVLSSLNFASQRVARDRVTVDALAQAKRALIAYAASDTTRPGELPCPDVNDDGRLVMNEDFVGSNCVGLIGRLPWFTLGLPDLRDEAGERLWYALSNDFHANGNVPLNSDTAFAAASVSLSITGQHPASNLVAIVFSPGAALVRQGAAARQDRGCTVGMNCDAGLKCTTSPASNTPKCNPANYLDLLGAEDNSDANRVFVSAERSDSFNDRLMPVHSDDIMWLVERRAGRELAQKLREHFDTWASPPAAANTTYAGFKGFFPWAATLNDPTVASPGTSGTTAGVLPMSASSVTWSSGSTTLGLGCSGVNTTQLDCTGTMAVAGLLSINGRVRNVGTAFIDPPSAANVTVVSGLMLGSPAVTWTLSPGNEWLDFSYSATFLGLTRIRVAAPSQSSWVGTSWLTANNWDHLAHYALSSGYALDGTGSCSLPGPPQCVSVSGAPVHAALVMAGRALPGKSQRPITALPAAIDEFLEGTNQVPANQVFERQLQSAAFNDLPIVVRP